MIEDTNSLPGQADFDNDVLELPYHEDCEAAQDLVDLTDDVTKGYILNV